MHKRKALICVAVACAGACLRADDATNAPAGNGDTVVVTATRTPRQRSEVPASVFVVSREQAEASPAENLDDLLRLAPGVAVVRPVGMGHGMPSQILVRGVPGDHRVLLLADGVPLNEAATGFQNMNEIPLIALERLEAASGPFSSLYGTDAFGGVVNAALKDGSGRQGTEFSGAMGTCDFRDYNLLHTGRKGSVLYALGAGRRSVDNYLLRDYVLSETGYDEAAGMYTFEKREAANLDYEDTKVLGKLSADIGDRTHLSLHARYFDSELGYGQTDVMPPFGSPENDRTGTRNVTAGGACTAEASPSTRWRVNGWYRNQARDVTKLDPANGAGTLQENDSFDWQVDGGADIELAPSHVVSGGVECRRAVCDFSPVSDAATGMPFPGQAGREEGVWNGGAYAQDEIGSPGKWKLVSGARLDYHSEFKEAVSPRAGFLCHVSERTTFRTSVGKSFRAPTLVELFQSPISFGPVTFESNPDLTPENIVSTDIEVEHKPVEWLSLRLALFHNDMDDLIENSVKPGAENVWWNENVDRARSGGAEAGAKLRLCGWLEASAGFTAQEAVDKETGADLDYIPGTMANAGLNLGADAGRWRLDGSVTEQYMGERGFTDWYGRWRDLGDYWRTDLALRATWKERIRAGVKVQNLTDEKYRESQMFALAPGRFTAFEVGVIY